MATKSKNPNNPTNSSIVQALLDAKNCGFPKELINQLLEFASLDENQAILKAADKEFKKHQYPLHTLDWSRLYNDIEFESFLTPNEYMILSYMAKNMWVNNLIQTSQNDMLEYTCITSKGCINKTIGELIKKGCIAIKYKGNSRQKTVYMVNPEFATIGTEYKQDLKVVFAKMLDTEIKFSENGELEVDSSEVYKKWLKLKKQKHYYRGRNSIEGTNFVETKKIPDKSKDDKSKEDS